MGALDGFNRTGKSSTIWRMLFERSPLSDVGGPWDALLGPAASVGPALMLCR